MKIILPNRGEFGLKIMSHCPAVHAIKPDVVFGERGESCLYPSAGEFIAVDSQHDDLRRGQRERTAGFIPSVREIAVKKWPLKVLEMEFIITDENMPREYFTPTWPDEAKFGHAIDVLICPRWRVYGANKNWHLWPMLAEQLFQSGIITGAAGVFETIDKNVIDYIPSHLRSWKYVHALQFTIMMMKRARLVVATDAGLAHLAMMVGAPLLLISHDDDCKVAPGGVCDPKGHAMEPYYWPIKFERFTQANHQDVPITMVKAAWYDLPKVIESIKGMLSK